jgi:hypothetical protein
MREMATRIEKPYSQPFWRPSARMPSNREITADTHSS